MHLIETEGVRMRRWWWLLAALTVMVAACGGGEATADSAGTSVAAPDSDRVVIESSDGMATLTISPAGLPDDVSMEDIDIEWVAGQSDEPGAPFAGVQLLPSGLVLSESATLEIDIPPDTEELLVVHGDADGFEFIEPTYEATGDRLVAAVDIDHFSVIKLYGPDTLMVTATAEPLKLTVGEEQVVTAEYEMWNPFVSIWIWVGDQDTSNYQRFDFRVESLMPVGDPSVAWWPRTEASFRTSPSWSPSDIKPPISRDGFSMAMTAVSECISANTDFPTAFVRMQLNLRLIDKGPVVTGRMLDFIEGFEKQLVSIPQLKDEEGNRISFTIEVDEDLQATLDIREPFLDSECVAVPEAATTSTSTSTTEPPGEVTEGTVPGTDPETTVTNVETSVTDGVYVITVTVAGDGRAMALSETTKWYNPRFIVETEDGGFIVDGQWGRGEDYEGDGFDSDFDPVAGSEVSSEWIDDHTFQTTVSGVGTEGPITSGRVEFSARLLNADGTNGATLGGDGAWGD